MLKKPSLGLIGAGNIGSTVAHIAAAQCIADVVLYDTKEGLAEGKALDISQSLAIEGGHDVRVRGTDNFAELSGCQVLVVTAGLARKPGMSRDDLLQENVRIFKEIGPLIQKHTPLALVVVVTNPLDIMTWVMQKVCGLPHSRVMGMAGILDSGRFARLLANALNVHVRDVRAMVLGGHGDLMVPVVSCTSINGMPLQTFIDNGRLTQGQLQDIVQQTRDGGAEIVSLLGTGSAYYAPAAACVQMVRALLLNEQRLLPCAAWLGAGSAPAAYGEVDAYMGVPAVLGKEGVHRVEEISFNTAEKEAFQQSLQSVQEMLTRNAA